MKTPPQTAILAASAMMGDATITLPEQPVSYACENKQRMGLNQRQKRKNRRRAWAAGDRKAFQPKI
jgi:hypothetical protein